MNIFTPIIKNATPALLTIGMWMLAFTFVTNAAQLQISATPIEQYQGKAIGEKVGDLIWRGGLDLDGPELFGGVSGFTFLENDNWVMVTDRGRFFSGQLIYENGSPSELINTQISPITNSKGNPLPSNFSRDAEGVETIFRNGRPTAIRVSFENLTRVADFSINNNRPVGPARELALPHWLAHLRTNKSLESVCIAPPASPIAGSTLLITEGLINDEGDYSGWLIGNRDRGEISLNRQRGFNPTDCAFLANGDLLVLERGTGFFTFTMQVRQIAATDVKPGAVMEGDIILRGSGGDIDNMEALAIRTAKDGSTRIVIMSDDNFNDWERTLLLEFELPQ
ncbi:MAG: esterase-like activity of phytase family protein [Devosiaceae bacterium]|nr:esterase-like activity of phytase family protein [Devosiaceae bacterium]